MVTHDPLHGSGRAALPHPALASGDDAKSPQGMSCLLPHVLAPAHCARLAGSESGARFAGAGSPWPVPFPPSASAAGCPALFGDFIGTTGLSDFLGSFIVGVRPWTSRRVPPFHPRRANPGPPGSRAKCFRTCTGSATARDPCASRDIDAPGGAFRLSLQRRRPGPSFFRGSIPGPHVPLSTLRPSPYGNRRMTRGRCGSLALQRMTLSFTTPRRFIPALSGINAQRFAWTVEKKESLRVDPSAAPQDDKEPARSPCQPATALLRRLL